MTKDKKIGKGIIRLRLALPAFFSLFLFITGSTIFSVNFFISMKSMEKVAFEYLAQTGTTVVEKTVNHLTPAAKMAQLNAKFLNPDYFENDFFNPFNIITIPQFLNYNQFALIYFGSIDGNFWMNGLDPDGSISTQTIERLIDGSESDSFLTGLKSTQTELKENNSYAGEKKVVVETALSPYLKTKVLYRDPAGNFLREEIVKDYIYDPRWRPWYKNSMVQEKKASWTGAYRFSSSGRYYASGKTGVTVSSPVLRADGSLAGVIGVDIFLEELTNFLQDMDISENGRAFISTPQGKMIAFGNLQLGTGSKPEVFSDLIDNPDLPVKESFSLLKKKVENPENGIYLNNEEKLRFKMKEGSYLAYFAPIPEESGPPWLIGVIAPEDDFIGDLKFKLLIALIITIVVLLVMVFLSIVIGNRITLPIKTLMEDALLIKDLDLKDSPQSSSAFTEIADMTAAFHNMKVGLRSFKKYIPSDVVRYLIKSGNEAVLGGESKILTIFFSDVADFTSISEQLEPGKLVSHLGDYLGEFSRVIKKTGGTVDKYIGDAVMAFWNAPTSLPDHAEKSCKAALECVRKLGKMHRSWTKEELPLLHTRIGIHTGEVIVGNMGSSERLNYTIIGDPVNLASRLEGLAKVYSVSILVSDVTKKLAEKSFFFRKIDKVIVKGKTVPVTIYELLAYKGKENKEQILWVEHFEKGLKAYFKQDWKLAQKYFYSSIKINKSDKTSILFLKRIKFYAENKLPDDWDGVAKYKKK